MCYAKSLTVFLTLSRLRNEARRSKLDEGTSIEASLYLLFYVLEVFYNDPSTHYRHSDNSMSIDKQRWWRDLYE